MARYVNADLAPIYLNETACEQIKSMPTEDVAPVIRCKDCIFDGFADEYENHCCERTGEAIQQNDFCSYGEKKRQKGWLTMANYTCASRTNYFRVTDETEYDKLFGCLCSEDGIEDMSEVRNGVIYHAFGCYDIVSYCDDSDPDNIDDIEVFVEKLQKILPDDEAFILFESGNEKLRYVTGSALIATKDNIEYLSIDEIAIDKCKSLLNNDKFTTQTSY